MTYQPISLPPGVVRPGTALQVKGRYWDANLVRWRGSKLEPVGGWQRITSTVTASPIRALFAWTTSISDTWFAMGCDAQLYSLSQSVLTDISPANLVPSDSNEDGAYGAWTYGSELYGDDTDPTYPRPPSQYYQEAFCWSLENWGADLLALSSSDGRLLHFVPGTYTDALEVGHRSISTIARSSNTVTLTTTVVHDFSVGDVVVVSGVSNNGFDGTFTVLTVPSNTTITYAQNGSTTTSSGGTVEENIGSARAMVVTEERHVMMLAYGGNERRVAWSKQDTFSQWDFADTTSTAGFVDLETQTYLINCARVREGVLIWTFDEVYLARYVGLPYIYSFERIGTGCGLIAPMSFAAFAGRCVWLGREGFWLYEGGQIKPLPCDVSAWVFDDMDKPASQLYAFASDNGLFNEVWFWFCADDSPIPNRYAIWNYSGDGWWSIGEMSRTAAMRAGVYPRPIAAGGDNFVYEHETGWTDAGASLVGSRYAETGALNIQNGDRISFLRSALMDNGYGYDSTEFSVFTSFAPQGTETTSGPYAPRSDGYTDMRATGRDFRVRIAATEDAAWSIGDVRIDVVPRGNR